MPCVFLTWVLSGIHRASYCSINQETLLDYYPLPEYTVHGLPLIILHHSFTLVQNDGEHE